VRVSFHDPYVEALLLADGRRRFSEFTCEGSTYDAVLIHTPHPGSDLQAIARCALSSMPSTGRGSKEERLSLPEADQMARRRRPTEAVRRTPEMLHL
jgi:hypothetical protein